MEPGGPDRVAEHEREIRAMKRILLDLEQRFLRPGSTELKEVTQLREQVESLKHAVDQLSSKEGVTLHRLETLKERIDDVEALRREVDGLKASFERGPALPAAAVPDPALREEVEALRKEVELLRSGQAALGRRLDGLKEENQKLRSQLFQLETEAHDVLEALQKREADLWRQVRSIEGGGAPRRPPRPALQSMRASLEALREQAAQAGEVSGLDDGDPEAAPRRGRGRSLPTPE